MATLNQLVNISEEAKELLPEDPLWAYFFGHFSDLGLLAVDEETEEEDDGSGIVYYDLIFENEQVVTVAVIEAEVRGERPELVVLFNEEEHSITLPDKHIEGESYKVEGLPVAYLHSLLEVAVKTPVPASEAFKIVIRDGKKVKKRLVRRRKHRLSSKQKAALRKARRFASRPSAIRKRKRSNKKRLTYHLKAQAIGSRFKLAS